MKDGFSRTDVLLLIAALAICIGSLEWLLRSFVFDPTVAYIRTPGWAMQVRTNDLLPNVSGDHLLQVNSLGIRGTMPGAGAKPRIAVLGGSTAEDWVLEERETWAQQLAGALRTCAPDVWVANLGKGGVNARHHLLQLPAVERYMPRFDGFVVLLGLNDFLFDLRIHHPFQIPEDWWPRQAFMSLPGEEGSSAILAIGKRLWKASRSAGTGGHGSSDFGLYQKHLRDAYARVTTDRWVNELPDLATHLANYRKTIAALKAYADRYGAPIVFVSQPYVWSASMSPETRAQIYAGFIGHELESPKTKWYTAAALEKGLAAYNATLLDMCRSEKLLCVDAAAQMPREAPYFYDDFHFSERGAALLGKSVAQAVRPQIPSCRESAVNGVASN
jgi:lysophospholipase L1-like esterase